MGGGWNTVRSSGGVSPASAAVRRPPVLPPANESSLLGSPQPPHTNTTSQTMKKLLTLTFALFFTAGITFAQGNTATVDQSIDGYNDGGNTAYISQAGGSHATVSQNSGDFVGLNQTNGAWASITQGNGPNVVRGIDGRDVTSQGSRLEVIHQGAGFAEHGNELQAEQYGDDNEAIVEQMNVSFAKLRQDGVGNYANLLQTRSSHDARMQQLGEGNVIRLEQNESFSDPSINGPSFADINQDGDYNKVGGLEGAGSAAKQLGAGHTLMVDQLSSYNEAWVSQTGQNHTAVITQD